MFAGEIEREGNARERPSLRRHLRGRIRDGDELEPGRTVGVGECSIIWSALARGEPFDWGGSSSPTSSSVPLGRLRPNAVSFRRSNRGAFASSDGPTFEASHSARPHPPATAAVVMRARAMSLTTDFRSTRRVATYAANGDLPADRASAALDVVTSRRTPAPNTRGRRTTPVPTLGTSDGLGVPRSTAITALRPALANDIAPGGVRRGKGRFRVSCR